MKTGENFKKFKSSMNKAFPAVESEKFCRKVVGKLF